MNKAFWSHFKHLGWLLEKIYLFLTPSKTNGRTASQQGAPTTCNLTYCEFSQQTYVQTLLASLGVVIGQTSALQWRGRRRVKAAPLENLVWPEGAIHWLHWGAGRGRGFWHWIAHTSYYRHYTPNPLKTPCIVYSWQHFPSKDKLSFPNLPASDELAEEQIFWWTDPLGAPADVLQKASSKRIRMFWTRLFFVRLGRGWRSGFTGPGRREGQFDSCLIVVRSLSLSFDSLGEFFFGHNSCWRGLLEDVNAQCWIFLFLYAAPQNSTQEKASSETQGQSVGSGETARRKFFFIWKIKTWFLIMITINFKIKRCHYLNSVFTAVVIFVA